MSEVDKYYFEGNIFSANTGFELIKGGILPKISFLNHRSQQPEVEAYAFNKNGSQTTEQSAFAALRSCRPALVVEVYSDGTSANLRKCKKRVRFTAP